MSALLRTLLPDEVAVAETRRELPEPLFADEETAIAAAVESRRTEFRTVRACARRAFAHFGLDRPPLPPGPDRAPVWPRGFVGSMTHCLGYRAAAVAEGKHFRSLGIDAEPNLPLPEGVWQIVRNADNNPESPERPGQMLVNADRLLFSAKESVFKALWPLTGRWLDFEDVTVIFDPRGGFIAGVAPDRSPGDQSRIDERLSGRWACDGDHLVTAVTVPSQLGLR